MRPVQKKDMQWSGVTFRDFSEASKKEKRSGEGLAGAKAILMRGKNRIKESGESKM